MITHKLLSDLILLLKTIKGTIPILKSNNPVAIQKLNLYFTFKTLLLFNNSEK